MNDDFGWLMPWFYVCVLGFWVLIIDNFFVCILLTLLVAFSPNIIAFFLREIWINNPWSRRREKEWQRDFCQMKYGYFEFEGRYASYKKTIKRSKRRKVVNFFKRILHIK